MQQAPSPADPYQGPGSDRYDAAPEALVRNLGRKMKANLLTIAALLAASLAGAHAQDYPNHYITMVAPFPAGGPSDTTVRLIAGPMSKYLGQQIIVENVTGAGGTIGSNRVAK